MGAGETHNGEWAGRVRWAARRVARRRVRRGVYGRGPVGFAAQPHGQRTRSGRRGAADSDDGRGASVDGRLMRLPRA